jgi:hypothetical protein
MIGQPWTLRMQSALDAVAVGIGFSATGTAVTLQFSDHTPEQRAAAQAVLAAFDFSDSAQAAWELEQRRQEAIAWIDSDTREARAVRAVLLIVMHETRSLKLNTPIPTRSWGELKNYLAGLIASGAGDPGYDPDGE